MNRDFIEVNIVVQVRLRQRRTLVGPNELLADEHHPPIEPFGPRGLGGFGAGQTGSGDHECLVCCHVTSPYLFRSGSDEVSESSHSSSPLSDKSGGIALSRAAREGKELLAGAGIMAEQAAHGRRQRLGVIDPYSSQ